MLSKIFFIGVSCFQNLSNAYGAAVLESRHDTNKKRVQEREKNGGKHQRKQV